MDSRGFETVFSNANTSGDRAVIYMRGFGEERKDLENKVDDLRLWASKRGKNVTKAFTDLPGSDPYRFELGEAVRYMRRNGIKVLIIPDESVLGIYDDTVRYLTELVESDGSWILKRR